jgi:hypothetical protein
MPNQDENSDRLIRRIHKNIQETKEVRTYLNQSIIRIKDNLN